VDRTQFAPKIDDLIKEVEVLQRRAEIRMEFRPPNITGIVYFQRAQEVTLPSLKLSFIGNQIVLPVVYVEYVPASSVIINNVAYNEGSKIDSNTILKVILSQEIIFSYKDEDIKVELKAGK
jgi:hypothetical protein